MTATPDYLYLDGQKVVAQDNGDGTKLFLVSVSGGNSSPLYVEPLGVPTVSRQLAAGSASTNVALTSTCRRISIFALTASIRFSIGVGAQTATSTSHYIDAGERLDFALPASAQIAAIRAGATDGTLEITELGSAS